MTEQQQSDEDRAASISPITALQLRLNQLQAAIGASLGPSSPTSSILLRASAAQRAIEESTALSATLRRFVKDFDANRRLLQGGFQIGRASQFLQEDPSDILRGTDGAKAASNRDGEAARPVAGSLTTGEQLTLILDCEQDMRRLDRILSECQALDQRGVTGSGRLPEYEALQPRLEAARRRLDQELGPKYNEVEVRLMATLESYQTYIDGLSRLFMAWDESLNDMERKVAQLEREKRKAEEM